MRKNNSLLLIGFLSVLITGCSSTPVPQSYYLLEAGKEASTTLLSGKPKISIRKVRLPGYLEEKGIAQKIGDGKVEVSLTDLWIEPLSDAVPEVLAEELSYYLKEPVMVHPIPTGHQIDTILEVDIDRWIADDKQLSMSASYRLITPKQLISNNFSQDIQLENADKTTLVAAHQQMLKAFAKAIANSLH